MAAGDLTTISDVKAWLKVSTGGEDTLLNRLITAVSAQAVQYVNRPILAADFAETYDGTGGTVLALPLLPKQPINSVSSLKVDDLPIAAAANLSANGYRVADNLILLRGQAFTAGKRNVAISYNAGWNPAPADLAEAVIEWVGWLYRNRDRIGLDSQAIAGETTAYARLPLSPNAQLTLDQYKRVIL